MKHLYLIDGSGFIFRAFHALPPMNRPDGTPINAVLGFTNMLMRLLETTEVDYLAVVFDTARHNFRHDIYPNYKAHRPEVPPELIPQFSLIRDVCRAFNVSIVESAGFEADDLIATYTREATDQGAKVTIVSSDKDLMQLVSENVDMLDSLKNKLIKTEEVMAKFGVPPSQVVEVQALAGDASDNVPGVPGIGPKTAAQLIQTFGSVENLLNNLDQIPQIKRRDSLETHKDLALISHQLVKLCQDVPLPVPLQNLERKAPIRHNLITFLKEQNFKSILSRIEKLETLEGFSTSFLEDLEEKEPLERVKGNYELVQTIEHLHTWIQQIEKAGIVSFDCETTSLNPLIADLVGISLSVSSGHACYIPLAHKTINDQSLFDHPLSLSQDLYQIPFQHALDVLKPILENPSILKIGHNIKYDVLVLKKYNLDLISYDDTIVMSYGLDGTQHGHGMDELAALHLKHKTIKFKDVTGTGKKQITFDFVPLAQACEYAAEDADITLRLYHFFKARLAIDKATTIYESFDRALIPVLIDMEFKGITADTQILNKLSQDFTERLSRIEILIYQLAGRSFNIASPKQLGELLFQELGYVPSKKGKSGAFSTGADILEDLSSQGHELPTQILQWRQLSKLKSTYTDALIEQMNPKTQRIHTTYSLTTTLTGRLASSQPNLQNIPIRTEEGRKIRSAFVAPPGCKLISFDYSQIELRLLAHMGQVPELIKAFQAGLDIHTATAAEVFGLSLDQVDKEHRRRAKTINFGIIYGMSSFGLARQLKVPQSEAKHFIQAYNERYPGILKYMEEQKEKARHDGFVTTLFGRKCYMPGINDRHSMIRAAVERQAINAPLQGTAADIIKKAMIRSHFFLNEENFQAKIILQVHDELIIESPDQEVDHVTSNIKKIMKTCVSLTVPLEIDTGVGQSWAQTE